MNMRKIICALMALALLVVTSAVSLAGEVDLQGQLDAANERIAALEAEVELYKPYYEAQIVAEYGDGGIVWLSDAQAAYESEAARYANYGISVDGYESVLKEGVLNNLVTQAVLKEKAGELGLNALSEDDLAYIEATADQIFNQYVDNYKQYFAVEGATDEETVQATIDYMASAGLTRDTLVDELTETHWDEALYQYVIQDVTVSEDEVRAAYEQKLIDDEAAYADSDTAYNNARNNGEAIVWNPEGYRVVTHVLVKFSDEQSTQYRALQSDLSRFQGELDALDEEAEEAAEPAEGEEPAEAEEPPRERADIEADIADTTLAIDALYAELLPRAEEVVEAFNGGADFDALIDEYGEDPGMQDAATRARGYAVCAESTTWDQAFTDGAMSIDAVGGISAPVYGMNGIHIIYYREDIAPGAVPFEDVAEDLRAAALEEKATEVYTDQVTAWVDEAAPVYHLDRF